MTGPKRELPPLVIRIISDTTDALKGMQDIAKAARRMAKDVASALAQVDELKKRHNANSDKDETKRRRRRNRAEVQDAQTVATEKEAIHARHLIRLARMDDAYLARKRRNELASTSRGLSVPGRQLGPTLPEGPRFWRRPRIGGPMGLSTNVMGRQLGPTLPEGPRFWRRPRIGGPMGLSTNVMGRQLGPTLPEGPRFWRRPRIGGPGDDGSSNGRGNGGGGRGNGGGGFNGRWRLPLPVFVTNWPRGFGRSNSGQVNNQYASLVRTFLNSMQRIVTQYMRSINMAYRNSHQSSRNSYNNNVNNRSGGGGFGGSSMMGARADMFMHAGALRSMSQSATSFLTPFAQVENATIQMRAYAGTAAKAKQVVEEMQQFAIASPYRLEGVLEATSMMMKYGQSAENAMEITRMLGDVAAGDTDKLRLLGLAVGQATGFGRLQGQELRQMVNAGFNPLKTAARELAGGKGVATDEEIEKQMDFLLTAMRKRQLDADIIKAALQIETSKGGDFVGITEEQAKSLTGWASQFLETLDLIKIQITEAFAPELKRLMELVVRYTTAVVGWMKANKELVKEYTMLALKVLGAVIAFHLLGMALATSKWLIGSLLLLLGPLRMAIQAVTVAIALFRTGAVTAWIAAIGPIGWLIIAIGAIGLAIAAVRHENGFWGLAQDAMTAFGYLLGFMYNFGHNLAGIFDFIAANWGLMVIDGILTPLYMIYDPIIGLANLIAQAFGTAIPDSVLNFTQTMRKEMARIVGINGEYDTSMFKFDGPKMSDFIDMESYKKALEPFMPPDPESLIKDKPNIDFKSFIKAGEGDPEGMSGAVSKMRDHAVRGSAEHAMRMYEYGQDQAAMSKMDSKQEHNKKMEDLLSKIERNTRTGTSPLTGSIEEAALV